MANSKKRQAPERRSGVSIMLSLIGLVRPLLPVMCVAIVLGVLGFLCAIFLTIIGGYEVIRILLEQLGATIVPGQVHFFIGMEPAYLYGLLIILAVARGLLHYGEQYCNHFIAFKLLALIRHKVFAALRRLCPAKLEGKGKGNLVSLITSDIELLEVFYAHTISPIVIAVIVSALMSVFIGLQHWLAGIVALFGYLVVGALLPLLCGSRGGKDGMRYRNAMGDLNSFLLESLHGLDETIQYGDGEARAKELKERSTELGRRQRGLNALEAVQRSVTTLTILCFSFGMLILTIYLYTNGQMGFQQVLAATIGMMGSFGPVVALSNLSNTLNQTLAAGERVLSLLEEKPQVERVKGKSEVEFDGAGFDRVDFAYEKEQILKDFSLHIPKNQFLGIHGASGSGKSTLLKLLMRFWDVDHGDVLISGREINRVNTDNLRAMEAYMTQETWLFHDTLANNIAIGRPGATIEEIEEAAKKASIHEFIESLPKGYDTEVGELGDTLSGGERQRIGMARIFLSDADLWLLDEPTSNLDALNEGMIRKALHGYRGKKTIVLVSHRKSTLSLADRVFEMKSERSS